MNNEEKVEELGKGFEYWNSILNEQLKLYKETINFSHKSCSLKIIREIQIIKEEAKKLKEEIKKGCGKEDFRLMLFRSPEVFECSKYDLCKDCQNLIKRLNKIIGDEE